MPDFHIRNGKVSFRKSRKKSFKMDQSMRIRLIRDISSLIKEELDRQMIEQIEMKVNGL